MSKALLKVKDVAERLNISYDATLDMIHSGALPAIKLPGRRSWRVRPEVVDSLVVGENPGTDRGTEGPRKPSETAPNGRCRTKAKKPKNVAKYEWMEQYT